MTADDTATQEQQHTGWRITYIEHPIHGRHRARVPAVDTYIDLASDFHSVISVSKYSMIFICLLSSRRPRRRATRPILSN
jgi:hypothetical protein